MDRTARSMLGAAAAVVVAALVAWAGSDGGATAGGLAVIIWCAMAAFAVNWVAFVPSWLGRTEKYYDLTGSITYLTVVTLSLVLVGRYDARSVLLAGLTAIWTIRLGTFLFRRILRAGSDSRFDRIKEDPARLFMTWTTQGLWVFLTLAAALGAITGADDEPLTWPWILGVGLWLFGFCIEALADHQKSVFKADPTNDGRFIASGLWAWSRHPNYFGEITLWVGIAVIALPALDGWRYVTLVSPVFVYLLLTRISGIPMLERKARKRWGDEPEWQAYTDRTPALFPRPPSVSGSA